MTQSDGAGSPKVMSPLWVISLFLGLSEVTVTIAITQASGWIQAMLAIFAVAFPTLVATVFFLFLWRNNKVLYAPREYAEGTTVQEYAAVMSRSAVRSVNIVETALSASLADVDDQLTAIGASESQRQAIRDSVTGAARATIITVDISAFGRTPGGDLELELPADDRTMVVELLNSVYFALAHVVPAYSYNGTWLLRDRDSGTRYEQIGTSWAREHLRSEHDFRLITEVGISAGSTLVAYPLQSS